jgi:hypothetical protein
MIKTNLKSQKPIETDASFKYQCPSEDCNNKHWLFIRQAQVKNFKIVCECGLVFKPKQIKHIKIIYEKPKRKRKTSEDIVDSIPVDLLNQCAKVLSGYGFDLDESKELIKQSYNSCKTNDIGSLIKNALKSFGEKNG